MADAPNVDSQKTDSPQQKPTQKRDDPPPILRAELQIPPAVIDEYKSWQQEKKRHEGWKLPIEVVALIAVVSTAFMVSYQGCLMRRATEAAEAANVAAEESYRNSNRAYIVPIGSPSRYQSPGPSTRVGVSLFATGYTPALNVRKGITWEVRSLPLPESDTDYLGDPPYQPGAFAMRGPQMEPLTVDILLSPGDQRKVDTPEYGVIVWGTVQYTTFDKTIYMRFCHIMRPDLSGAESRCPVHNSTE